MGKAGLIKIAVIFAIIITLGWFSSTYFLRLRALGYVDSAIVTMRSLVAREDAYARAYPRTGYSCKLSDIADSSISTAGYRNGYLFEVNNCKAMKESGPKATYTLTARPVHSGMPAFCANESGIVKADYSGSITNCLQNGEPL